MPLQIPFDNTYARLPEGFFARLDPTPVRDPSLIAWNAALARELQITGTAEDAVSDLSGTEVPEGAAPLAQLYAGHQFGHFNPQLGDGRALLLGEVIDRHGQRRDLQLKGSGQTPFSRMGDGRAWLGPVLREYLVSEAMHALGVPTTRALAALRTGEIVLRDGPMPGAILTRVAASHIRVGTFQVFAARDDTASLQTLFDYTTARHTPDATTPEAFLAEVITRQADLIAHWMSLGFIHGVMNTDNCTISGETIDYGPCAFLDAYDPGKKYSSIDQMGRYAYAAQADIIVWNMAQLATALLRLMPDPDAALPGFQAQINAMPDLIRARWLQRFGRKLGLSDPRPEDAVLISDLLSLMHSAGADFTNTFRDLAHGTAAAKFPDPAEFDIWRARWERRISDQPDAHALMAATNPQRIPRNHQVEAVIAAAVAGDDAPFHRLLAACTDPFTADPAFDDLAQPPRPEEEVRATFCGT